jgi:hypothetical protein
MPSSFSACLQEAKNSGVCSTAEGPIGSEESTMMASKRSSVSATNLHPSAITTTVRSSSKVSPGISG